MCRWCGRKLRRPPPWVRHTRRDSRSGIGAIARISSATGRSTSAGIRRCRKIAARHCSTPGRRRWAVLWIGPPDRTLNFEHEKYLGDGMHSAFLGEFLGTMIMILLGNGVVANVVLRQTKGEKSGWIVITTGWCFAVMAGVFTALAI